MVEKHRKCVRSKDLAHFLCFFPYFTGSINFHPSTGSSKTFPASRRTYLPEKG